MVRQGHSPVSRKPRPSTPREIRRRLRQEVYYSCPLCDDPLLIYHHIIPWHEEEHFREEDMIALCAKHARLADANAISRAMLYNVKANPPRKRKIRDRFVVRNWEKFTIALAAEGMVFRNCLNVLRVQGQIVIGFTKQSGAPALALDLRAPGGNQLLKIEDNDWIVNVDDVWDCEVEGNSIKVYERLHKPHRQHSYYVRYRWDTQRERVAMNFHIQSHGVDIAADKNGFSLDFKARSYGFQNFEQVNCSTAFDLNTNAAGDWGISIGST